MALELQVLTTVFRRVVQPILTLGSQMAIVLSLVISIMGVFRIVKKYMQFVLDRMLAGRAAAGDVARRNSILSEHGIANFEIQKSIAYQNPMKGVELPVVASVASLRREMVAMRADMQREISRLERRLPVSQ